jgi:hypothetical protein
MVRACVWLAIALGMLTLAAPAGAEPSSPPPPRPWDPAPGEPAPPPARPWDEPAPGEPAPPPARPWDEPAPTPPEPERPWYGWQTLATDGVALALIAGAGFAEATADVVENPLITTGYTLGVATYALGGPIVHVAHGKPWRGLASFGIRVPAPVLVAAATYEIECGSSGGTCGGYTILFGTGAMIAAIIVDAAVFAYDDVPVARPGNQTLRLLPVVGFDRHGGSVGLALTL